MDMLQYIISYMNAQITAASHLFDNVRGLCDYEASDKSFYEYTGKGQGVPVTNYDAFNGTLIWVKRADVTTSPDVPVNFRDTGCKDYLTIVYPLRAIGVVKKQFLPCDNSTAADQVGQELMLKLGGRDKVLRSQLQAMYAEIVPRGYSVQKEIVNNLNYTAIYFNYDVRITLKQECVLPLCENVPLPPCEYTITLNNSEGETIYVITQDSDNPFTLAPQPIVDGNGNAIDIPYDPNTPYVTTPCEVVCDDATINVNGDLFNTVASGGTLNVPVQYEDGTPVGTITGGVVEVPNPVVCDDATAVLKDTDGNTLSTTNIPSGASQDITAPDGSVTVNGSAFDSVLSGGSLDVPVEYENGSPVGTIVAGVVQVPDPETDLEYSFEFPTGLTPLEIEATITASSAGTYTSAVFSGSISSATYEKNGSPATLPITVVATDTLKVLPDVDNGIVTLSGTY